MFGLFLIVAIADQRAAISTDRVRSLIEVDTLVPVPRASPHVAGLTAMRSRLLTVIDCRRALGFGAEADSKPVGSAVVVTIQGHGYALAVDEIFDVVEARSELKPIRSALSGGWRKATLGMVETALGPIQVIDIEQMIAWDESLCAA